MEQPNILNQRPKQMVEDAILAAMLTKRITAEFKMSSSALEYLYKTIEHLQGKEVPSEEEILIVVSTFLVAYGIGFRDGESPNKKYTKYHDYGGESNIFE